MDDWNSALSRDGLYRVPLGSRSLGGRIRDPETRAHMAEAIRAAVEEGRSSVLLYRPEEGRMGVLIEVRTAREDGWAIVNVASLDAPPPTLTWELISELLHVTRAEAEIALDVLRGDKVSVIAGRRRVQVETVRTQLKNLLRKTGVPNQKQLTALLARIAMAAPSRQPPAPFGEIPILR